ncbi:nucleoside deaminase [Streptomyces sp. NEAU-174]|uniref:nucleoside deaminase n=1 Tax=Streptomyces sp. NEAU-174 TaxID=3458254 RepID=UPI00404492B8
MPVDTPMPGSYGVRIPPWLAAEQATLPVRITDRTERMRMVNRIAARNVEEGTGGPFAALVLDSDTGDVVSAGVNLALSANVASAHAEVVALSLAQTRVGDWNLGTDPARPRVLVVNAQPCVMCLGTLIWSGVKTLDFSVPGFEVERITGFDEGPVPADWREQLEKRGIAVDTGLLQEECSTVLEDFRSRVAAGTITLYNGG